jgi:uncharacterized membrane protein
MEGIWAMNLWLLASGVALLFVDLVHVFAGGREIHRPMVGSTWPAPAKAIWSVVWHMATAVMLFGGLALIMAAFRPSDALELAALPLLLTASTAVLFVAYSLTRLGNLRILPHWIAFSGVTLLGVAGLM